MLKSKFLSVFVMLSMMFSSSAVLANDDGDIEVEVEAVCEENDSGSMMIAPLIAISLVLMYGFHKAYEAYDVYMDQTSGRVRYCARNDKHSALGDTKNVQLTFGSPSRSKKF